VWRNSSGGGLVFIQERNIQTGDRIELATPKSEFRIQDN